MKNRRICIWIMLASLAGVVLPGSMGSYAPCSFDQVVIKATTPDYTRKMIAWAEWIWPRRRRRHPHRYLLPKKLRRHLHFRRRRMRQWQRRAARERRKR